MKDQSIPPVLAKMLVGDDQALAGAGKMVFTRTSGGDGMTLFGGVLLDEVEGLTDRWQMAAGTMIFVPMRLFEWKEGEGLCGWRIDQLICGGLAQEYWCDRRK